MRLLHRRDRLAPDALRPPRHRVGSRRIHPSSSTAHPDSAWVTQQARNLALDLETGMRPIRFLIRDRDTKFIKDFDAVVLSEGARVILTPIRAPNASAYARARDRDHPRRVRRLDPCPRSAPPRPDASDLRPALQPQATPSTRSTSRHLSHRPATRGGSVLAMFVAGTCSAASSMSTTEPPRDESGFMTPTGASCATRTPWSRIASLRRSGPTGTLRGALWPSRRRSTRGILSPGGPTQCAWWRQRTAAIDGWPSHSDGPGALGRVRCPRPNPRGA